MVGNISSNIMLLTRVLVQEVCRYLLTFLANLPQYRHIFFDMFSYFHVDLSWEELVSFFESNEFIAASKMLCILSMHTGKTSYHLNE